MATAHCASRNRLGAVVWDLLGLLDAILRKTKDPVVCVSLQTTSFCERKDSEA